MANIERFKDLDWVSLAKETRVTLVGLGGIGSWTSLLLCRTGIGELIAFDGDRVEEHNMGGQLFSIKDIGESKTNGIRGLISKYSPVNITLISRYINLDDELYSDIVITGLDSMASRKVVFDNWKSNPYRKLFIDGRLLAESYQIFTVLPGNEEAYENYLFDDSEIEDVACTAKQTSHFAAMIASHIVNIFTNYLSNIVYEDTVLSVPFRQEYVGSMNKLDNYDISV